MDLAAIEAERARLHAEYVKAERPQSSARGIHHTALLSSDVERTIRFYQGVLEFPLADLFGNRDYPGSTQEASGTSLYFRDPDGGRLALLSDPLGEMYGSKVL